MPAPEDGLRLVYGIVRSGFDAEPDVSGVTGHRAFDVIEHRRVAAVASIVNEAFDATPDDLRAHLAVLDDLMGRTTVLPMRFGTLFDSQLHVVDLLLAPSEPLFAKLLDRLEGLVEMRLRAVYREEEVLAAIVRSDPVIRRRQERIRALPQDATYYDRIELGRALAEAMTAMGRQDASEIEARMAQFSVQVAAGDPPSERRVTNASFLVARQDLGAFGKEAERLAEELGDRLDIRTIGPMPPFSFADLRLDDPIEAGRRS